jgi:excisionase family DNA binding protein
MEPALVSPEKAARYIGIGRTKFYDLMASEPELTPIRIGRCVRIPVAALDSWIERQIVLAGNDGSENLNPGTSLEANR